MAFWDKWRKENKEPRETQTELRDAVNENESLEEKPAAESVEAAAAETKVPEQTVETVEPEATQQAAPPAEEKKTGLWQKLKKLYMGDVFGSAISEADEAFFEDLEEMLILADVGMETAVDAVKELRQRMIEDKISGQEPVKECLREILAEKLQVGDSGLNLSTKPSVILVIGVNGVGKTTSIGKLAARYVNEGKKVMLSAADTFRAAAADQLEIWAKRAGADIVRHGEGADPAAVVFDSIAAAKARGSDIIIVDTAGRLHNKANLMNELAKIDRVISRELPDASRETLLVLDATTGQNAVHQAEEFNKAAHLTGIVLTKLDGTAKGGIVIAISAGLGVPVKLVGVGEGIDDLVDFDRASFLEALLPPEGGNE